MMASFVALVEVKVKKHVFMNLKTEDLVKKTSLLKNFCFQQSTGAFIAVARYASATPVPPSVLSRGVGWQVINR